MRKYIYKACIFPHVVAAFCAWLQYTPSIISAHCCSNSLYSRVSFSTIFSPAGTCWGETQRETAWRENVQLKLPLGPQHNPFSQYRSLARRHLGENVNFHRWRANLSRERGVRRLSGFSAPLFYLSLSLSRQGGIPEIEWRSSCEHWSMSPSVQQRPKDCITSSNIIRHFYTLISFEKKKKWNNE